VCFEGRGNSCKRLGLCNKRNCKANQVRELEAGCSRRHLRSRVFVVSPRSQRHANFQGAILCLLGYCSSAAA
jgi:hypothetical protein